MMRATIQLLDRRSTPMTTPNMVARMQPRKAMTNVFSTPTMAARKCEDCELYSMRRWLMS